MIRYYSYYWKNRTIENARDEGKIALFAAANGFVRRGVCIGDYVYGVTVFSGRLFLIKGLQVGNIYSHLSWCQRLGTTSDHLWDSNEFLIAQKATKEYYHLHIQVDITRTLLFYKGSNRLLLPLKFVDQAKSILDCQTLRGIRELPKSTADIFNTFLGEFISLDEDTIIKEWWKE
jgi:hypothetical protein